MQSIQLRRICIVRAKDELNGFPASLALMKRAIGSNLNVHALLLLHVQKYLPAFFLESERFKAVEFFDLNSPEELRRHLATQNIAKNSFIFIDSLSVLIDQFSLPSTSYLLNQLSELSACVLAMIGGSVDEDEWRRLESLSTTIFQLELAENGSTLCRTKSRKKDETFEIKVEEFNIQSDYSIQTSPYTEPDFAAKIVKEVQAMSIREKQMAGGSNQKRNGPESEFDKLPFDVGLNLSEKERRAKENVQLPYMAAQSQKGLVGLNISSGKKLRAGGQIIYTPDKEDDFDEDDPDDDLTI